MEKVQQKIEALEVDEDIQQTNKLLEFQLKQVLHDVPDLVMRDEHEQQ